MLHVIRMLCALFDSKLKCSQRITDRKSGHYVSEGVIKSAQLTIFREISLNGVLFSRFTRKSKPQKRSFCMEDRHAVGTKSNEHSLL